MLKKERYNLTLSPRVVSIIDKFAEKRGESRSEVVNNLLCSFVIENRLLFTPGEDIEVTKEVV